MAKFKVSTDGIVKNSGDMKYYSGKVSRIGSSVSSIGTQLSINSDDTASLKDSLQTISKNIIENAGKIEVLYNALIEIAREYNTTEDQVLNSNVQGSITVLGDGTSITSPNGTFVPGDPDATKKGLTGIYEKYKDAKSFYEKMKALSEIYEYIDLISLGKKIPESGSPLIDIMIDYVANIVDGIVYNKSSDQFTADFFADIFFDAISIGPLAPFMTIAQGVDLNHDQKTLSDDVSDYILHEILEKEHAVTTVEINKEITPEEREANRIEFERIFKEDWNNRIKYDINEQNKIKPINIPENIFNPLPSTVNP